MRIRTLGFAAALFALAASGAQQTYAATATTTFTVNATVLASCLVAATNLNFGVYSSASASNATSTVTATCTPTTDYTIALDAGAGASATLTTRSMTGVINADALNYALYTDAGHTTVWGDGTTLGTGDNSGTGNGTPQAYTVYGQIPASQSVSPDTYQDTINVTLTY